ncbi:MATE efflux family protein [Hypoxylon fragiforme]|uniref:MATE efflux family protein n=1 Tax=Hypoxylon fragiforme TaxID=63214 RepID=UPI0020C60F38|nr:MATE efflux family protein [Hypoxylon fragiforme]KAI2604497.1 MATE efflux family protein [Hypoxylon fragiforme]
MASHTPDGEGAAPRDSHTITERTPLLSDSPSASTSASVSESSTITSTPSFQSELYLLTSYSLPLITTYLLQYSYSVITTFVAGHLSASALAAASIGMTAMNIVGFATIEGMATALDTLCAQAYGSGNLPGVGLHVQRMLLVMALAIVPIAAIWAFSPWILSFFVRQPELAVMAGSFLRASILGLPGYAGFEAGKRFLQAQGAFRPAMLVLLVCTPVNALLSWLLAFRLAMGLEGAALAVAITNTLRPLLLLLYIASPWGKWSRCCWGGFSRDALAVRKWGPVIRLSCAGSAVNLGEWFASEVLSFSTAYLSTRHLAAQSVLTTVSIMSWHIPFSVSVAVSTRIGHLVGAGLLPTARRAALLYSVVFTVIGVVDGGVIFALRDSLPPFFSDDKRVCELAANTMLTVAVFQVIDSIINCTNGLLRGLGRQGFAAWVVFAVNYLGAVPLAMWLELGSPGWGLQGVWIGLGCGMVVIAVVEGIYMKMMRWEDCVESAKEREEGE